MKLNIPPVLIIFALVCFALVQNTQAVDPPPDGGYPGGNTAEGQDALLSLTSFGTYNTAVGLYSLLSNTVGSFNTAVGAGTLLTSTGEQNTAIGAGALLSNVGNFNTANGAFALFSNFTGEGNTAVGDSALFNNTSGSNTAIGAVALYSNSEGESNTAVGDISLYSNTTGGGNTAVGSGALFSNTAADRNTAIGGNALANTTGGNNLALGFAAGVDLTTGDNNIDIGNYGIADESNTIRIGGDTGYGSQTATFIAGISGTAVVGDAVVVDGNGQLGTVASSERLKKDIATMDKASEAVLALRPVTFHYKTDTKGTSQFGLIAEEVAKVNPKLVLPDKDGKPYTVRYDAVNAMLLNEFIKQHRKVQQQEATIADLRLAIAEQRKDLETTTAQQQKQLQILTASLKEQAAQLEKVSARVEVNKRAPQTVVNNQ
jgi:Chaperone of endosialidase